MARGDRRERISYIPVVERKFFKNNNLKASISARGDSNPLSGFYFPLFSMVFPWGISIGVETGGKQWNQKCSFFVVSLHTNFLCVLIIACLFTGT